MHTVSRLGLLLALVVSALSGCKSRRGASVSETRGLIDSGITGSGEFILPYQSTYFWADGTKVYRIRCGTWADRTPTASLSIARCKSEFAPTITSLDIDSEFMPTARKYLKGRFATLLSQTAKVELRAEYLRQLSTKVESLKNSGATAAARDLEAEYYQVLHRQENTPEDSVPTGADPEAVLTQLLAVLRAPDNTAVSDLEALAEGDHLTFQRLLQNVFGGLLTDAAKLSTPPYDCVRHDKFGMIFLAAQPQPEEAPENACRRLGYELVDFFDGHVRFATHESQVNVLQFMSEQRLRALLLQTPLAAIPDTSGKKLIWGGGHILRGKDYVYVTHANGHSDSRAYRLPNSGLPTELETTGPVLCSAPVIADDYSAQCGELSR